MSLIAVSFCSFFILKRFVMFVIVFYSLGIRIFIIVKKIDLVYKEFESIISKTIQVIFNQYYNFMGYVSLKVKFLNEIVFIILF